MFLVHIINSKNVTKKFKDGGHAFILRLCNTNIVMVFEEIAVGHVLRRKIWVNDNMMVFW